jgi:hypothetical protein
LRRQSSIGLSRGKDAGSPGRLEVLEALLGNERNTAVVRLGTVTAPWRKKRVWFRSTASARTSRPILQRVYSTPVGTPPGGMQVTKTHN